MVADLEETVERLEKIVNDDWIWKHADYYASCISDALELLKEKTVIPHRNYSYLSQWWCECGWHLGRIDSGVKYCANCGRKVDWDGAV